MSIFYFNFLFIGMHKYDPEMMSGWTTPLRQKVF